MKKRTKKKTRDSNLAQKHRDLLKFAAMMQDSHANYVILGVENQMEVHYAMPVRNMVYDALQYDKQVAMIAAANRRNKRFFSGTMRNNGEFLSGFLSASCPAKPPLPQPISRYNGCSFLKACIHFPAFSSGFFT